MVGVDRKALRRVRRFLIRGRVQGVGFRPFVARLANALGVAGWVRNVGWGVEVAVTDGDVTRFLERLRAEAPTSARIDAIEICPDPSERFAELVQRTAEEGKRTFVILPNGADGGLALAPDRAVCRDCMAELCDPHDRRWRYPFVACTACGPRYTVSTALPYARAATTLAAFPLCPECQREFDDPTNRRYHAETTACPVCGPQLRFLDRSGQPVAGDPIALALACVRAGGIVALKGLGGFQLVCDARAPEVVATLRARKRRPAKPFAVMGLNAVSLAEWVDWTEADRRAFESAEAPIVLTAIRRDRDATARAALDALAPGLAWLGVMRPTTPLHLLLWHEACGRPVGTDWLDEPHPLFLVMTSGNRSGAPLAADDGEAFAALADCVDGFLTHDRPIAQRADDSVVRTRRDGKLILIRRARGFVPEAVALGGVQADEPGVALGSDLKLAAAFVVSDKAYLTPYLGELTNRETFDHAWRTLTHWRAWLGVTPRWIAHDTHPDALSRRLAEQLAAEWQAQCIPVWHHPAHLAAVIAETTPETAGPWVGWSLDGFGWGEGGEAWGGELLQFDACGQWRRLDHFPLLPLPGGDRAAREPWRLAVAVLACATGEEAVLHGWWARRAAHAQALGIRWPQFAEVERLWRWLRSCPNGSIGTTSSVGRWFDAVSALLGLCAYNTFEGEAALRLESAAARAFDAECAPSFTRLPATEGKHHGEPETDWHGWWSWVASVAHAVAIPEWAAAFHHVIAETLVARARPHLTDPILLGGGGCWQNRLLIDATAAACARYGVTLRLAQQLPANDGGIALGQAWLVLAARRAMTASQRSSREETSDVSGNTRRSGCAFA